MNKLIRKEYCKGEDALTNHWYAENNEPSHPYSRYSRISIDDAMAIALERVPGEVVKVELDTENGLLIYEVDIMNMQGVKYEVEIDARTGEVIKIKRD